MAVTTSSGPGIALKQEAIGLAVMTELPLIIINVQRGGPSTGLADENRASRSAAGRLRPQWRMPRARVGGRSPADCFDIVQEAWQIAVALHDAGVCAHRWLFGQRLRAVADSGRVANVADRGRTPWARRHNGQPFMPYARRRAAGAALGVARHAGLDASHRRFGKARHYRQRQLRAGKPPAHGRTFARQRSPALLAKFRRSPVDGAATGQLLVLSWGGTYGSCATAARRGQAVKDIGGVTPTCAI